MTQARERAELALEFLCTRVSALSQQFERDRLLRAFVDGCEHDAHAAVSEHSSQAVVVEHDRRPEMRTEHACLQLVPDDGRVEARSLFGHGVAATSPVEAL